jgi:hypothetical protein
VVVVPEGQSVTEGVERDETPKKTIEIPNRTRRIMCKISIISLKNYSF